LGESVPLSVPATEKHSSWLRFKKVELYRSRPLSSWSKTLYSHPKSTLF